MKNKILRKLIEVEIRLGFLYIPASGIELMPETNSKILVVIDKQPCKLTYNSTYKRIFGLKKWYKVHNVKVGDKIVFEKKTNKYKLSFDVKEDLSTASIQAKPTIDISGLSTQAKGNVVEDRIKEIIVLQGQGLLSVYKPVTDTQGIDLIVTKNGIYQPIFLQIKGRFNIQRRGYFLMDISKKTFTVHHSYFVIGAYFNPQKLEIDEHLLLVPSDKVVKAPIVKANNKERYRIANRLSLDSQGRWAPYIINKSELANKLIEKFEEIGKYFK